MNTFEPDYRNILKVLYNQKPDYLPLYEHNIDAPFVSKCIGEELSLNGRKSRSDLDEYFSKYISFWKPNGWIENGEDNEKISPMPDSIRDKLRFAKSFPVMGLY